MSSITLIAVIVLVLTVLLVTAVNAISISNEMPLKIKPLSRGDAYTGSLTVAGLAVFGSTVLAVVRRISKSDPLQLRLATTMTIMGPFAFAGTHIYFAGLMCCVEPTVYLPHISVYSGTFLAMTVLGVVWLLTTKKDNQGEKGGP